MQHLATSRITHYIRKHGKLPPAAAVHGMQLHIKHLRTRRNHGMHSLPKNRFLQESLNRRNACDIVSGQHWQEMLCDFLATYSQAHGSMGGRAVHAILRCTEGLPGQRPSAAMADLCRVRGAYLALLSAEEGGRPDGGAQLRGDHHAPLAARPHALDAQLKPWHARHRQLLGLSYQHARFYQDLLKLHRRCFLVDMHVPACQAAGKLFLGVACVHGVI